MSKNFDVGLHSNVSISVWFKLGIDIIEFYILILIYLTVTLIQYNSSVRMQILLRALSHKVFSRFRWTLVYCSD